VAAEGLRFQLSAHGALGTISDRVASVGVGFALNTKAKSDEIIWVKKKVGEGKRHLMPQVVETYGF